MPMKSLFSLYPQLMTCPLALVSWQAQPEVASWDIVEWVGVVCARPSRVSFALADLSEVRSGLNRAGCFSISLPHDDRLCRLQQSAALAGRYTGAALPEGLSFAQADPGCAPSLADCPVSFFCRLDELRGGHGRLQVSGVVRSIQVHGRVYELDNAMDICNIDPLNPRWFKAAEPSPKTTV